MPGKGLERSRSMPRRPATKRARLLTEAAPATSPLPPFDCRARLPLGLAPLDGFALVVFLLALCEADRDLHAAILEVHPDGDERHPLLDGFADELQDFVAVQQQLPAAQRLVLGVAAMAVRADVDVVQVDFAVLD